MEKKQKRDGLEEVIGRILSGHRGQENALPRKDLVDRVNQHWPLFPVPDREIRKAIVHLIEKHGQRIGSSTNGYFIIETVAELEKVISYYESYGMSSLYKASRLRKLHMAEYLGQLKMRLEAT